LLSDLSEGRYVLSVRSLESEQGRRHSNLRALLIALAVVSMSFALLLTLAAGQPGPGARALQWVLWPLLFVVYVWMAIIWRRLR
jgi:hypothetical protein